MRTLTAEGRSWPFKIPFRIARGVKSALEIVTVTLTEGAVTGRGEGVPVTYNGEDRASVLAQIEAVRPALEAGASRADIQTRMPAGSARNAVDCALWDFDCKRAGQSIFALAGSTQNPVTTAYTVVIDAPAAMAGNARSAPSPVLKVKVDGAAPVDQVRAVREARPDATLIVDANGGLSTNTLDTVLTAFHDLGVRLVEQPFKPGEDAALKGYRAPMPLCADESCQTAADLPGLVDKYQFVNIKLDKTGGLTHALELAENARGLGFQLMVGSMAGTSLAMAPAYIIAQACVYADLDGPLLLKGDRDHAMIYDDGVVSAPAPDLWG